MDHLRLRRRDRGRDRVSRLTRAVTVTAAAGALIISVGAARSNPGRFTSPPKTGVVASGRASRPHRRIRPVTGEATNPVPPPATASPPTVTVTPAPPVTVSGGS